RTEIQTNALALVSVHLEALTNAAARLKELETAGASLQPLLIEVERRLEAGSLPVERIRIQGSEEAFPVWTQRVHQILLRIPEQRADVGARSEKWEAERKILSEMKPSDASADRRFGVELEAARILYRSLDTAAADESEMAGTEAGLLEASIARTAEIAKSEGSSLSAPTNRAAERRAVLEGLDRERLNLRPPSKDDVPDGEGHAELRAARQGVLHSDALVAYHKQRVDLLERARTAAAALLDENREVGRLFEYAVREQVRLMAQLTAAQSAGVAIPDTHSPSSVWAELVGMALAEASRIVEGRQLEARVADASMIEVAKTELAKEIKENERLRTVLREEETYATFVAETTALTDDELLALLAPQGEIATRLAKLEAQIAAQESGWKRAEANYLRARKAISILEIPYTQRALADLSERTAQIKAEFAALGSGQIPVDRSNELVPGAYRAEDPAAAVTNRTSLFEMARHEQEDLEAEQAFALNLVRFYTDLDSEIQRLRDALAALDDKARGSSEAYSARVSEEKRGYACALELDSRIRARRLLRSQAPRDLQRWQSRESVRAAEDARDQFVRRETRRQERRRKDLEYLEAIAALRPLAETRAEMASRKVALIGDPVAHLTQATTPFEQLPEVKRKELEYEAAVLRSREGKSERHLAVVAPEIQQRFEEPINAFHIKRVDSQRIAAEYKAAHDAYEALIELSTQERETLAPTLTQLKAIEEQRLLRYRTVRHLAAIALHPESASKIVAAFRATYGQDLLVPDTLGDASQWIEELFSAEARLLGHRRWMAHVERQLSKLGIEATIGSYRRSISSIATALESERSRIEDLKTRTETLEKAYLDRLRAELGWDFLAVLVIPLAAFVVLQLGKRVVRRIRMRTEMPPGEDQTLAQRRLQTLTNAVWATFSALVWIVTGVFVLRRVGMDVTPIIASASVVGLAVAFGAQALIRDFFYGFFILMENQFTVGDVVKLGEVAGVVERMSLRVTVLRDIQGVVHYVPNGTIQNVSNMTQNWSRVVLEVPVAYNENTDRVTKVLEGTLRGLREDARWRRQILEEPTVAGVENFDESAVAIRVLVKTAPGKQWDVSRELRRRIKQAFDAEGIVIPFPQRVVHHVYEADPKDKSPTGGSDEYDGRPAPDRKTQASANTLATPIKP
ncbi:MAG: mechanosensitive ion channel domain-containing protein, partial [Limisphaerales bacterium]